MAPPPVRADACALAERPLAMMDIEGFGSLPIFRIAAQSLLLTQLGRMAPDGHMMAGGFPLLPGKALVDSDICGGAVLLTFPGQPEGTLALALRLRPGIDMAREYPAAAGQIREARQLLIMPTGTWIAAPRSAGPDQTGVARRLLASEKLDPDAPVLLIGDVVLGRLNMP